MTNAREASSRDPAGLPTAAAIAGESAEQADRLECLGRLTAGVTHEVNTNIQVISDSLHFVRETAAGADAPEVIDRALDSLDRIASLVRSLKEFARPDERDKAPADLNHAIRSTLVAARHEYKYVADVTFDLAELPLVTCFRGKVSHAILNVVLEATGAVNDAAGVTGGKGAVTIRTRQEGNEVVITVTEAADGRWHTDITAGVAVARAIVVDMHGGDLTFETMPGTGTTCVLRLPIDRAGSAEVSA